MEQKAKNDNLLYPSIILALGVVVTGYLLFSLSQKSARQKVAFQEETALLTQRILDLESQLITASEENEELREAYEEERERNDEFEDQIDDIAGTVGTLEKLSKTDPELLQKYSKVYFLNEHYIPPRLSSIDTKFRSDPTRLLQIHAEVRSPLEDLLEAAEKDGLNLRVASAYRSFGTQSTLKAGYTFTYGTGANQFSADQGYSEHQLGTTVDFSTIALSGSLDGFENTPEYAWLLKNAYRFGFILSYPTENAYYQFEPWHWRFVGKALARYLHRQDVSFYDLDQRTIDEYLVQIFD